MRYRARFQLSQLFTAAVFIAMGVGRLLRLHADAGMRSTYLLLGLIWLCLGAVNLATYFTTWWEIGEDGLAQGRLFGVQRVPWTEVTRIGPWQPGKKPQLSWIEVDYVRAAPMSDKGTLLLRPAQREDLLRSLRAHAPQAQFEF
jgi:hypothetical protein